MTLQEKRHRALIALEKNLGWHFSDIRLLDNALTHRSFVNETDTPSCRDNERLEFLGDAVLELTISDGIVSGMRNLPQGRVIQTTAPISPGSSGGPLFDAYGRLVGIMTFQHRSGQNLNFAVPADWIADMRSRSAANPLTEAMQRSMAPN